MRAILTVLLIVIAAAPAVAQTRGQASNPSFDCRRARTPVERVICGRPELGDLDRKLSGLYASAPRTPDSEAAQRAWLARRDSCVRGDMLDWVAMCIGASYRDRILALEYNPEPAGAAPAALETPDAGPSFDCRRASDPVDALICSDSALSALDAQMARLYAGRRANDPNVAAAQQRWLADRDTCLRNPTMMTICVAAAYTRRIAELQ